MEKYDPSVIEPKWQKEWEKSGLNSPDIKGAKKPFYNLTMFPYPSAEGLHVGNMYAFTAGDVYGRFKKLQGYDVFEPVGLDGFGIHSENFALKIGRHPKEHAARTEKHFYEQLHQIGNMYDWKRKVETYNPNYYKWTQWLFLQMYKAGLAYRGKASVNFCPKDKTVLSDEQVIDGKCERCGTQVEKRELEQWFFKITKYADRLLEGHKNIDWSEKVIVAQRNWIGKKTGINITYEIEGSKEVVTVFTTRPDTNFGATFVVLAPEHPLINKITTSDRKDEVTKYVVKAISKTEEERIEQGKKKTGVFTGSYAVNQLTGKKMPIWVADFALMGFGTGAVVGVPGHDLRDFEFAKEFGLEIIRVVVGKDGDKTPIIEARQVQEEEGKMINSDFLNGMDIHKATDKIMDYIESKGWGKRISTYHLRDWSVSRQRYWGPPIPMIFCKIDGWQPVPEEQLPVLLPDITDYVPEGNGKGPLEKHPEFYETTCPVCGDKAKRETDVSDVFVDSAWYFLRYPTVGLPNADKVPFDKEATKKWLPVDMYTGGPEHAVLHLMYARFVTMVLKDQGLIDFEEPFKRFFAHGMLIKDGAKMSKSKGNVINPDEYIQKFGADAVRLYLSFMGPVENGGDFRDASMHGMRKWVEKVYRVMIEQVENARENAGHAGAENELNRLIKKAEEDFEARHYNTTIAKMMEFINFVMLEKAKLSSEQVEKFLIVLAPFAPHLSEELWQQMGNTGSIHAQTWPKVDEAKLGSETVTIIVSVNGKARGKIKIGSQDQKMLEKEQVIETARSLERVAKYLEGKTVKNTIYVQNKVVNFVV